MTPHLVWPVAALLGEGPAWIDDALWFVDIKGGALHRYDPARDERRTFAIGGRPSFVVPTSTGELLVGDGTVLRLVAGGVAGAALATVPGPVHNRTNDATVDAAGRLWFGTMDDEEAQPTGAVHVFDGERVRIAGGACTITNGPAISPDGRWLYHVDTLAGSITRFALNGSDRLEQGERLVTIAEEDGKPDGVTVDSEGCLWVGLWGGWAARRYSPDGALMTSVPFPCANVTKLALGGPSLATAYVTTARIGLSDDDRAGQPLAGGLFAFEAPAPGLPLPAVRLAR